MTFPCLAFFCRFLRPSFLSERPLLNFPSLLATLFQLSLSDPGALSFVRSMSIIILEYFHSAVVVYSSPFHGRPSPLRSSRKSCGPLHVRFFASSFNFPLAGDTPCVFFFCPTSLVSVASPPPTRRFGFLFKPIFSAPTNFFPEPHKVR